MKVVMEPIAGVIKTLALFGSTPIKPPKENDGIISVGILGHLKSSINFFFISINTVLIFLLMMSKTNFTLDLKFIKAHVGVSFLDLACFTMPVVITFITAISIYVHKLKRRGELQALYFSAGDIVSKYCINHKGVGQWSKKSTIKM